ncbi:YdeI/OmpD-associated family protein [Mucilaginibacter sp.]|uniref:YdeI/OmpD-associated family protein n=1 Tax=Mucilaginibacter sp. TaxID=1882438 RepID=UPI003D12263A
MSIIAKKLQIKPGKRWLFYSAPDNYLAALEPLPEGVTTDFYIEDEHDGIQLFVINRDELSTSLGMIARVLKPDTIFWITYPKKSSGSNSDLQIMGNWDSLDKYGLQVVAAISIDHFWTALRIKPKGLSKLSDSRNDAIKQNEYANYIDVDNKLISLPEAMQAVLAQSPNAMAFYESLSYSNKKEYVIWILSAKQESTKQERLVKLVEKLLDQKKNPSEK